MPALLDKFKRDIGGILWLSLAIFLFCALTSYSPLDPSLSSTGTHSTGKIINLCGYIGAYLSDALYQLFGLVAWWFMAICLYLSYSTFRGQFKGFSWIKTIWGGVLVLDSASLFSLTFPDTKIFTQTVVAGGILGELISRGLVFILNRTGVAIVLWALFAISMLFISEKRITEVLPSVKSLITEMMAAVFRACKKAVAPVFKRKKNLVGAPEIVAAPSMPEPAISVDEPNRLGFPITERATEGEGFKKIKEAVFNFKKRKTKADIQIGTKVENWQLPDLSLFLEAHGEGRKIDDKEISKNAKLVEQKLAEFDVLGKVVDVKPGPAVTMYEFKPAASIKINDITKLADDLSLALSAESLRIIAPIPGRDVVGIETSNSKRASIFMRELIQNDEFWAQEVKLPVALGKSVSGEATTIDLRKIPHLLVAGTTGSGKSVFIMSLVTSLIVRHSPKTLRLLIIDPKQVDLATFHKIPHLLMPPVKEARPAVNTLKWLIREMEKRYRSMSRFNAKNIEGFNATVANLSPEDLNKHEEANNLFEQNPQTQFQSFHYTPQPYIVAVIEEFADLMSVDRAGVEPAVVRLAQMARASGIHLVIAMQSPRREVLTGLIKTNFPGRICFKVASKIDSSIVLDQRGAERLLSVGDMLYLAPGMSQPQRYHGAFLRDEEMNAIAEFWMKQGEPEFNESAIKYSEELANDSAQSRDYEEKEYGAEYDQVVSYVSSQKEVSASLLQRRFRFGYPKAARIIEILENEGVVGPSNGSKPRQVLINTLD